MMNDDFISQPYSLVSLTRAAGMGALSGVMGIVISGAIDLPSGPSIVLVQLFGFLAVALSCHTFNL
jgi:ABC-type Mn2+/Zn2+ transport system permease subunit